MLRFKRHAGLAAMAFAGLAASSGAWASNTLSATYYTVRGDPAFGTQCCGTYPDMVTGTLGPDGLPVLNTSAAIPASFMANPDRRHQRLR